MSVSWLLQGLSQPDRRRDWRPRPRSVTPGGPLDDGISWEPGMPPQLGKSILLLPTAASSDSLWSEIQFRDVAEERREEVLEKNCCFSLRYIENVRERLSHKTVSVKKNLIKNRKKKKLPSSSHLPVPWLTGELTCCFCAWCNCHASPSASLTHLAACDMAADALAHPC